MNIEIAKRLTELRKSNNLSQEALAEKMGISRQAVSKWERAEASPDTDNLILLSKIYGISLDDLLRTENELPVQCDMTKMDCVKQEETDPVIIIEEEKTKIDFGFLRHFPIYFVAVIAFLILGALYNAWHPGWLLFFLPPIWHSAIVALEKRDARKFAYPVFVTFFYLCIGLFYGLWHPGWIVFLTIPCYYPVVNYFRKLYIIQKKELDEMIGNPAKREQNLKG
ncbi:MAG: helix-turn-helix transcriptional regulator [Lachnospiraceae bacterium]|nr:helix-turn-helix transcriptional regulator [Lachnospiraceae bacterium]